jgi:hypothetical protein
MVMLMTKIYVVGMVVLTVLIGCSKTDSDRADCSKITGERERAQCLAHKESTKDTDVTTAQQSPPKKW